MQTSVRKASALQQGPRRRVVQAVSIAAAVFGVATMIAGTRALLGASPGYVVYLPLLRFNAAMGLAYVAVGVIAWRNLKLAVRGAVAIFVLNACALAFIAYLYQAGGAVARESLQAMAFRTVVWLLFLFALLWAKRAGAKD